MSKILKGKIESVRKESAKVSVERVVHHKKYFKELRKKKNFIVQNDFKDLGVGDLVEIIETRPISKLKYFKINKIIKKNDSEIY